MYIAAVQMCITIITFSLIYSVCMYSSFNNYNVYMLIYITLYPVATLLLCAILAILH